MKKSILISVMVIMANIAFAQIMQSDTLKIGFAESIYGKVVYKEVKKDICTFHVNGVGNVAYQSATNGYSGYMIRQSFPEREENGNTFYYFYDRGKDQRGSIYFDLNEGYIKIMYDIKEGEKRKVKVYYYKLKSGQ
jgi:hypothetical protein